MKTKLELARKLAARSTPRFVEIEPRRVTRFTAAKNANRRWMQDIAAQVTELLGAEHQRLTRTWEKS